MNLDKGLNRDLSPEVIPEGSWVDAKNVLFSKGFVSIENEKGTEVHVEVDMDIIGIIPTSDGYVVFSTDDTYSEIGVVREGEYTKVLKTQYLYFNKLNPIEGVYKYNYNNELVIAWTDATQINPTIDPNSVKLLNLDNLPFVSGLDSNYELNNPDEITVANFFPTVSHPVYDLQIEDEEYKSQGNLLKIGVYYLAIAYYIDKYNTTPYFGYSDPIYITNRIKMPLYTLQFYQKEEVGEYVSASINVRISSLSNLYKYCKVVLLSKTSGTGEYDSLAKVLGKFEITSPGYVNVELSSVGVEDIDVADVLIKAPLYHKYCKTLTNLNNRLILGNITKNETINYQPYANNIKVTWNRESCSDNYRTPTSYEEAFTSLHFVPTEVYALYIHFVLKNGTVTPGYHIPGREVIDSIERCNSVTDPSSFTALEKEIGDKIYYYQIHDTSTVTGIYSAYSGELSYWENTSEVYPNTEDFNILDFNDNVIGSIKNSPVRHHKMPSLSTMGVTPSSIAHRINLYFSDIAITQEIIDNCSGYFFSMAKRTFANSTVLGDGPILDHRHWIDPASRSYLFHDEYYNARFHNFALLERKPSISPSFTCLLRDESVYTVTSSYNYVPENNTAVNPSNEFREEHLQLIPKLSLYEPLTAAIDDYDHETVQLKAIKGNVYAPFYNQSLTKISPFISISSLTVPQSTATYLPTLPTIVIRGDSFMEYVATNIKHPTDNSYDYYIHQQSYSPVMVSARQWEYKEMEDSSGNNIISPLNQYVHNLDYYSQSDYGLKLQSFNNSSDEYLTSFPNRLHLSDKQLSEDKQDAWRIFPTDSYYESVKDRGVIWKLDNDGKDLLIEHQKATFVARIVDTIKTVEGTVAALGQAEIFDTKPIELIATNSGYVGCQSQFASFRSKVGNIIVDGEQGKIFLYKDGKVDEISQYWLKDFFKINLPYDVSEVEEVFWLFDNGNDILFDDESELLIQDIGTTTIEYKGDDNPFNEKGIMAAWDDEYNRFIFSKKQIETIDGRERDLSMTVSFDYNKKVWVSFHDYTPNLLFNNRYGLYSVKDSTVHIHNTGDPGEYYGTLHDSYIDIIFNLPRAIEKAWDYFSWSTEVITSLEEHQWDKTVTSAIVYNYNQHSDVVTITPGTSYAGGNVRSTKGKWYFNDFKDLLSDKDKVLIDFDDVEALQETSLSSGDKYTNWYDKSKFKGKFVILRLIYNNTDTDTIRINDINAYSKTTR